VPFSVVAREERNQRMYDDGHDLEALFGRRVEEHVFRERIVEEGSGAEFSGEGSKVVSVRFDGVLEILERLNKTLLPCGHLHRPGDILVRCDACSRRAGGRPVLVCPECAFTCPVTGQTLCVRCGKLGPDGRRYSRRGYRRARRLGFFTLPRIVPPPEQGPPATDVPSTAPPASYPARKGFLRKLLEWW